jgi:RimJ/RimL family protein N-acetyltransferase
VKYLSRSCSDETSRSSAQVDDATTGEAALETSRLFLRRWRDEDLAPFAAMNADPRVMEFLPEPLTRSQSDVFAERIRDHFEEHGFGLWAIEVRDLSEFIGFVGLAIPRLEAHFTPCVEIGWRLAHSHWNRGYASEAAQRALQYAFRELKLDQIVSFTVPENRRSRAVMEKLGLSHCASEDFDHPGLPDGHRLKRHVLYRSQRETWLERASSPLGRG